MKTVAVVLICLMLVACAPKQGQNVYKEGEVGISRALEYGTVRSAREVQVEAKNSGIGTALGAGVGVGGGSYVGQGDGNVWATAGAAVAGAVIGTVAERAMSDDKGILYTISMQNGETKSIVQRNGSDEPIFKPGQKVSMQYCDAGDHAARCKDGSSFQRLEAVDSFPAYVKKRRKSVR
jgi:outer membrane lipoprotein SlyB